MDHGGGRFRPGVAGGVAATTRISQLDSDLDTARIEAEGARDDVQEITEELEDTEERLRELQVSSAALKNRLNRQQETIEKSAFGTEGLSADVDRVSCRNFRCTNVAVKVTFSNVSDTAGAVLCAMQVELANGDVTHFDATSPYVPAGGTDTQVVTYYGDQSTDDFYVYDSDDCERYGDI